MSESEEAMKTLIRRRASYKGQVTAFKTYISGLDAASLTLVEVGELQLRTDRFESLYTKYDEVQLDIECLDVNLEALKDRVEFENSYYQMLAQAHNILAEHKKQMKDDEDSQSSVTTRVRKQRLVKLPTIQLPKFSGAYENWIQFRDTFASLIDSVEDIDEINKFHYLRASLEGSAAVVIQSVEFSAKNYSVAWKLLCERYDNKRLLIQNHVSALFNTETITKESSISLKRLIDNLNKNLRALESLGEPVKTWDTLIIYIVVHKLDSKTFREWEEYKGRLDKSNSATLDIFITFLRNHADLIETIESSRNTSQVQPSSAIKNSPKIKAMVSVQQNDKSVIKVCPKCNGEHALADCPQFLALSNEARLNLLPQLKLCFNCFRADHFANRCKKQGCKICKRKHNALVHLADFKQMQASSETSYRAGPSNDAVSGASVSTVERGTDVAMTANVTPRGDVLLSTALVKLYDSENREFVARALLDSGSTACLMTEKMSNQLNLPSNQVNKSILGINNTSSYIGNMCHVQMKSLKEDFSTMLQCYVLPTITDEVPCRQVDISNVKIPSDLCLADPNFHAPASIDLIIGADVFWDILGLQHIKLGVGKPVMQETKLGWIISGPLNNGVDDAPLQCSFVKVDDIHNLLPRFWQLEEVSPQSSTYSAEEKSCEEHFIKHTTRQEDGRFCVRIPLKESAALLGNSYNRAKYCLLSLERRLKSQPKLEKMYKEFLSEYESLGHMSECHDSNAEADSYYIPHHGVLRENRTTTKLRVVFNASSPTTSGLSLNNIEMVGPTVQDSLFSILLRFRMHKYVLSADVEKMYRCVMVHKDDRHLQRILWRNNSNESIKVYELNTVTYGTASAPFLATRCLKQIGLDCKDKDISDVIIHDFYVDDLLTSTNELQKAMEIRDKVSAELASAGMNLRKWKSNDSRLVSEPESTSVNLDIGNDLPAKTLGLTWESKGDELLFPIKIPVLNKNTKRDMLSTISQIFDPLGLLAPCIIKMKMLLQKLWLEKLDWDTQLSTQISHTWTTMTESLPVLNELRVSRPVVCDAYVKLELHIFTDASERAYGACVYVRSVNEKGEVSVRLLTAKSRVAPLKPTIIPRLELCAALVGTRLYEKADIDLAVAAAKRAFHRNSEWRLMDASQRRVLIHKFAQLVLRDSQYLAELETHNNGMLLTFSKHFIVVSTGTAEYLASLADKFQGDTLPTDGDLFAYTLKQPVGVCGLILPWNGPIAMFINKVCTALAAGCTMVVKPAEQTPLTALALGALLAEAGVPAGVVNIVPGYGETAGHALTHHPDVAKISFTGSREVGKIIQQAAGAVNLKRITLELGGKSPLVVMNDANLDLAVQQAAFGLFTMSGQMCIAASRLYVQSGIYEEFVKRAVAHAKSIKVGAPTDPCTQQGPQTDEPTLNKILEYIDIGKKEGAKLMTGGKRIGNKGNYVEPTVFADVKDDMAIAREEIFGPVQSILKFETLEEVIDRANDTSYGLAAGIITSNINNALQFSKHVEAGSVWVNTYVAVDAHCPFGGFKDSGIGRECGRDCLENYLETKSVVINLPKKI